MSFHSHFDNPTLVSRLETAPIVLRFASMFPRDLKRRDMHDKRTGGDLTHIRLDLSHLNTQPVGGPDWVLRLRAEIAAAIEHNFEEEIAARERKGRRKEAEQLRERGPVDPWKFTREGPLREGIITVNKLWFGGAGHENWDPGRVEAFKQRATAFLLEHFPDNQLRELDIDEDEEALHLHFVVAVWVEKVSLNRGIQWLLQPSANPLLANYEHAQDLAGEAFSELGIHRGERRAEAARQALAAGLEMPEPRKHVSPSEWRREQRRLALEDRARIRAEAQAEAAATVAEGVALAQSAVKKCRKRSIAEGRARRAEVDRQVAAAKSTLARVNEQAEVARHAKVEAEAARKEAHRRAEKAQAYAARTTEVAEYRARAMISDAKLVGTKTLRKVRRRAAGEAQALRADAERLHREAITDLSSKRLAAAFVKAWTARLQTRANGLAREIAAGAKTLKDRDHQVPQTEQRLAQIEQERVAAEAGISQAQETAAGILVMAEARAEEARRAQTKVAADRIEAERLVVAAHEKASRITDSAKGRAGIIVADATRLASATLRKSRKRAIADARARRVEIERVVAAAEHQREAAEGRAERARQAQLRAQAEREVAADAAAAARAEAVRLKQTVVSEAVRIRSAAAAAAASEQERADDARRARDEAEAACLAAYQAAAEVSSKAEAERTRAALAVDRAKVVAAGLTALTEEIAAGTLRLGEGGRVIARAHNILRPAFPEIAPAVRAAVTAVEKTRAARLEADNLDRAIVDIRRAAEVEIARERAVAAEVIAQECHAAQVELKKQREAVASELDAKLDQSEALLKKMICWLSHPDLPAEMKGDGIDIASEAVSVMGGLGQDGPDF